MSKGIAWGLSGTARRWCVMQEGIVMRGQRWRRSNEVMNRAKGEVRVMSGQAAMEKVWRRKVQQRRSRSRETGTGRRCSESGQCQHTAFKRASMPRNGR